MGKVTDYLIGLIARQVEDHGLVVWYDPEGVYSSVAESLNLPDTTVLSYEDSFIRLRWEIDREGLMAGEEPPRLVVYVPMAREETDHALIELEAAGVVMQPGQQPRTRNTRLAVVARNALKDLVGHETATRLEKQAESGKLTLADLDALAEKGGELSRGLVTLIFETGIPAEAALSFLSNDRNDEALVEKEAVGELLGLLRHEFGFAPQGKRDPADIRAGLARHVLMSEFASAMGDGLPSELSGVSAADTPAAVEACGNLARTWRLRRDARDGYVKAAQRVETELDLGSLDLETAGIEEIETFPIVERLVLRNAVNRLLLGADPDILSIAESRLRRFWCDVEPSFRLAWTMVSLAARVLLHADRVEEDLKKGPGSVAEILGKYTGGDEPWCLLDTCHRKLEERWHDFEPGGDDDDAMEKLVIRVRQRYAEVAAILAQAFLERLRDEGIDKSLLRQQEIFEKFVKPALPDEKTAYLWVDALRFEMGRDLSLILEDDFEVDLQAAVAAVPTITEIGMAALLPPGHDDAKLIALENDRLALSIGDSVIKDRKDRVSFLKEHAGATVFDTKLDRLLPKPSRKVREGIEKAQLILVTSQEIDELCEQDNITQARRQMDGILKDLCRAVRVLRDAGVRRIILAADHGHIFAEELTEDMKVDPPGGDTADIHRRVWIGRGGSADDSFVRIPVNSLGMSGDFDLVTPWGFACFKCKGGSRAYFHGGLSPQELVVPVMILTHPTATSDEAGRWYKWRLIPGSEKLSTRFFSVQITGSRTGLLDCDPPTVRVEIRAGKKTVSKTVCSSYGFHEATGDVALRKDEKNPKEVEPNTVTLMISEDPDQKTVSVHLVDAGTGVELAGLEKIPVTISV